MICFPSNELHGALAPLVTPFLDGRIDDEAWASLVDWQVTEGSHGVVVGGPASEACQLSARERRHLARLAVDAAAERIRVIVAASGRSTTEIIELAEHAGRVGANAILVSPATTEPRATFGPMLTELARRTDVPLLVHVGSGRGTIDMGALTQIAMSVPTLAGINLACADLAMVTQAQMTFGSDFRVLAGFDELAYPMLALGAHGVVSSTSNIVPGRVVELFYAVTKDGYAEGRLLHRHLFELNRAAFYDTNPIAAKYMMWRLGILPNNELRPPLLPASAALASRLDGLLATIGLTEIAEAFSR